MEGYQVRAKRKDWEVLSAKEQWIEGYLVPLGKYSFSDPDRYGIVEKAIPVGYHQEPIVYNLAITEIDPATVGKYAGLTDKNGRKIFEGDIVRYHFGEDVAPIKFGTYQSCFDSQHTEHCGFYVDWKSKRNFRKDLGYWIHMVDAEIIGNIFDNPELIGG